VLRRALPARRGLVSVALPVGAPPRGVGPAHRTRRGDRRGYARLPIPSARPGPGGDADAHGPARGGPPQPGRPRVLPLLAPGAPGPRNASAPGRYSAATGPPPRGPRPLPTGQRVLAGERRGVRAGGPGRVLPATQPAAGRAPGARLRLGPVNPGPLPLRPSCPVREALVHDHRHALRLTEGTHRQQ